MSSQMDKYRAKCVATDAALKICLEPDQALAVANTEDDKALMKLLESFDRRLDTIEEKLLRGFAIIPKESDSKMERD